MNSFFKTFFACFLAIIASSIFAFFAFFAMISLLSSALTPTPTTYESGSVLTISLSEGIVDKEPSNPLEMLDITSLKFRKTTSLAKILNAIESASTDPKIEGIYLNINTIGNTGLANITEIRESLKKFKESGKFLVSYSEVYSQPTYFLSSISDRIFLAPSGDLQWTGLSSQTMFFKGTLEKLGIEPEIIRHGKYKSAVEPFTQDKMSPENREQISELLKSAWGYMVGEIATARSIDSTLLQKYASDLSISSPKKAVELKLVDELGYPDVATSWIKQKTENSKCKSISLLNYINSKTNNSGEYSKNKIALLVASGEIVSSGDGEENIINSQTLCSQLSKLRDDSSVNAVVLRINSPGGSALASDMIWNEVELLKATKPVIVSMGEVAASGGYYIAAPADIILVDPTTITGSIGVFGVLFNAEKGLREKLGVTIESINTNTSADIGSISRSITPAEKQYITEGVERVYNTFVTKVAAGRNLTFEQVDKIGGGRVWSGVDAVKIGLADGFGGIKEAVALAADRAGIADSYRIYIPENDKNTFSQMMSTMMEQVSTKFNISSKSTIENEIYAQYESIKRYMDNDKIMTAMPYTITIK